MEKAARTSCPPSQSSRLQPWGKKQANTKQKSPLASLWAGPNLNPVAKRENVLCRDPMQYYKVGNKEGLEPRVNKLITGALVFI